jgi:hypothetical protein
MPGGVADSFASHAPDQLPLVAVQVSPAMMREPAVWNPACRAKRGGLEFCKMKAGDALQARVRGAEVWPLSIEAYHALGEAGLMPERTELLYGFINHKMSKPLLHTFLMLRLLRLLQAVLPPELHLRPEQPLTWRLSTVRKRTSGWRTRARPNW